MKTNHFFIGLLTLAGVSFQAQSQCNYGADIYPTGNPGEYQIDDLAPASASAYSEVAFYLNSYSNFDGMAYLQPSTTTTTYIFQVNGLYLAQYFYYDSLTNCSDTLVYTINVTNTNTSGNNTSGNCLANFSFINNQNNNMEYFFSSGNYNAYVTSYWNFGDGNVGYGPYAYHTYSANGTYNVCHTIIDSMNQCSDTVCQQITVNGNPPNNCNASFIIFQDSLNAGQYYAWNLSTSGNQVTYYWDFGDGNSSNIQFPTHAYANPGTYTICLTIIDSAQMCSDTYCDTIQVTTNKAGTTFEVLNPFQQQLSAIEYTRTSNFKLYPNPNNGNFRIAVDASQAIEGEMIVFNLSGQIMSRKQFTASKGSNTIEVDQSSLTDGIYLIQFIDNKAGLVESMKFIKQ